MMGFGAFFSVLVLAALAYVLGWLPQNSQQVSSERDKSALDILKVRYARGEISKAEYEAIRDDLTV